ncbi:MAG: RimK family protein, partial [Bdellovibrionales bacterium]|nr:RimK family protein [Bdellovibrionales bacterium]
MTRTGNKAVLTTDQFMAQAYKLDSSNNSSNHSFKNEPRKQLYVVLDDALDWQPFYPSSSIITVDEFLALSSTSEDYQVINLCSGLEYLSSGYYVSLLAEARGQRVLPSVTTINDLANFSHYQLLMSDFDKQLNRYLSQPSGTPVDSHKLLICFGQVEVPSMASFARQLFEQYPCPILFVDFVRNGRWGIKQLGAGRLADLSETQQDFFGNALDTFSKRIWRKPRSRREFRYEMAILHNPEDSTPCSNRKAITKFIRYARENDIDAEIIGSEDFSRLLEYDALFIRETTAINHHTYRFAKKAESNGLIVIDHPESILRCANKVYLKESLEKAGVSTPRSLLLIQKDEIDYKSISERIEYPLVIKIPDGSFSIGVERADDEQQLRAIAERLFKTSTILLLQEYLPTEFDWRIGIINNRPIYACRYLMARGHWQHINNTSAPRYR